MEKIETLFDRGDDFRVLPIIRKGCEWVTEGQGIATEKLDGTNVRVTIQTGKVAKFEKRRNPSREEKAQGVEPSYVDTNREDPSDKHIFKALDNTDASKWPDGSWPCEAVGPKIQGNPLGLEKPTLYNFTLFPILVPGVPRSYIGLQKFFPHDSLYSPGHLMEGIVWHREDGQMVKIKAKDFPLK